MRLRTIANMTEMHDEIVRPLLGSHANVYLFVRAEQKTNQKFGQILRKFQFDCRIDASRR